MLKNENQIFKNFISQEQIIDSLNNQKDFDPTSKKKLRGRKIKNPLPNLTKCEICLEYNKYSSDSLISCSICKCNFHKNYYPQLNKLNSKEF